MSYVNLLSQDRTPGSGPMQPVDPLLATRTFSARVVGTGKVVAELKFEGSDNEANWEKVTTLSLSGTDSDSDAVSVTSTWPYVRAVVTAISGVGAAVTAQLEAISDGAAAAAAAFATGGLFGAKTIVVSTDGDDTAGAASKYAAEFLTHAAALTASASGDTIVTRPGSYAPAALLTLKAGVGMHFMLGARVTAPAGDVIFYDGGLSIAARITGDGTFICGGISYLFDLSNASVDFEAMDIPSSTTAPLISFSGNGSLRARVKSAIATHGNILNTGNSSPVVLVSAPSIQANQRVVYIGGAGAANVTIEADQSITGGQILVDSASTGATRVSIKAPTIAGLGGGSNAVDLSGVATGALYTIEADSLAGVVRNAISGTGELHLNVAKHTSDFNSPPLIAITGKTFYRCDEVASSGDSPAIIFSGAATVHLLSGRIFGGATAPAILFYSSAGLLRLYPGTIIIAAGTESIGVDTAITPTVLAMGDIATNKAANVGVVVAVGSLLVDAAVV